MRQPSSSPPATTSTSSSSTLSAVVLTPSRPTRCRRFSRLPVRFIPCSRSTRSPTWARRASASARSWPPSRTSRPRPSRAPRPRLPSAARTPSRSPRCPSSVPMSAPPGPRPSSPRRCATRAIPSCARRWHPSTSICSCLSSTPTATTWSFCPALTMARSMRALSTSTMTSAIPPSWSRARLWRR